jgi:hypothetical protein
MAAEAPNPEGNVLVEALLFGFQTFPTEVERGSHGYGYKRRA